MYLVGVGVIVVDYVYVEFIMGGFYCDVDLVCWYLDVFGD